jgi:hypothetical protein
MKPWLKKLLKKRKDGRWEIKQEGLPLFPDHTDELPGPVEIDGRRKQWVGIGWIDEGPAQGDEPLVVLVEDEE